MHRSATLLVTAVSSIVLSIALAEAAAWPDGAQQIVYARDYVTCSYPSACDGSQAKPWTSTDGTGGIQAAINACGLGLGSGSGCVVMLPRGVVSVSQTIEVGVVTGSSTTGKEGITLQGHGAGNLNSSANELAGTTLLWTGATTTAGTAVMRVSAVAFSTFADFSIDGGKRTSPSAVTGANIGIDYTANTHIHDGNNPGTTQQNVFERINIEHLSTYSGTPVSKGVAFRAAPGPNSDCDCQVSETSLRNIATQDVPIAYQQDGSQTTGMKLEDCNIMCTDTCIDLQGGDAYIYNSYIGSLVNGVYPAGDPIADIRIDPSMHNVVLVGNTHESCSTSIILAESGVRFFPTTLIGERLQQYRGASGQCGGLTCNSGTPCYIINYAQNSPLVLTGGFYFDWDSSVSGDNRPRFHFGPIPSGQLLTITSHGNTYASTVKWDDIEANKTFIDSNDRMGTHAAFESANWLTRNIGTSNQHPMVLQNQDTSGAMSILAWITQGARFRFYKQGGGIEFQGADSSNYLNLQPASTPTGVHTVSLPDATGTVLLDSTTSVVTLTGAQALSSKDLTNTSNVFPQTSAFAFSYSAAISAESWFGPNTGNKGTSATAVSVPLPAMTAKSLYCKLGTAPGTSKTWTLTAQTGSGNGTTILSCAITGSSATTCSATGTATWTAGSNLSLRATPTSSPAPTTVFCALGVSPEQSMN